MTICKLQDVYDDEQNSMLQEKRRKTNLQYRGTWNRGKLRGRRTVKQTIKERD